MSSMLQSLSQLYTALCNVVRLFQEARQYKDLEIKTDETSFVPPMMLEDNFIKWVIGHKGAFVHSLHILGKNADATKTIRADFLLTDLPFEEKDVGVKHLRGALERIHTAHEKDRIKISTFFLGVDEVFLPREMEVTLIPFRSLTADAHKMLTQFKAAHRRITLTQLSMCDHLYTYLLDHPYMPRELRRLGKEETKQNTPKGDIVLNELKETKVEILLIGAVANDVVKCTTAIKNGVNLTQYFRIIP